MGFKPHRALRFGLGSGLGLRMLGFLGSEFTKLMYFLPNYGLLGLSGLSENWARAFSGFGVNVVRAQH